MYSFRTAHGPADLAFTDRYGGVSASPYDELNLSVAGGDAPRPRPRTTAALLADFAPGDGLCDLYQVHGADVAGRDRAVGRAAARRRRRRPRRPG